MAGDGLLAVFDDTAAAIAAVIERQLGMTAIASDCGIPLKMRCGLHAGVAEAREEDYFGSAVNRATRADEVIQ
jgi:class 3 adenylate cyclase